VGTAVAVAVGVGVAAGFGVGVGVALAHATTAISTTIASTHQSFTTFIVEPPQSFDAL
jgi:hypothetical protein